MEAKSDVNPGVKAKKLPVSRRLPGSKPAKSLALFKEWQRLPLVEMPLAVVPPKVEEFRNYGINE